MSFQSYITEKVAANTQKLNEITTNSKKTEELEEQNILDPTSKIRVSQNGVSKQLEVQKILDATGSGGIVSSDEYKRAVTVFAEASSYYSVGNYPVEAIGKLYFPKVTDFTNEHWLSANGTTADQVVALYYEKGIIPKFASYINGGNVATGPKGGWKNVRIYGMTSQEKWQNRTYSLDFSNTDDVQDLVLLFDATGSQPTDGQSQGHLKQHSYDQYFGRGERLELPDNLPIIYGTLAEIGDRFNENYQSFKRFWIWH